MRWALRIFLGMLLAVFALGVWSYRNARADPVFRQARIAMAGWPAGARPVRVAFISDIHLGSSVMDVARLKRIATQIAARQPDLVVIAGDFVAGHGRVEGARSAAALGDALAVLRLPLGIVAVRGNHDNWSSRGGVHLALARAGIRLIENEAVVRGPLSIGGIADVTRHPDPAKTFAAMRALPGARVLVAHEPDYARGVPHDVPLFLAAHTHCGQIVLPFVGPVKPPIANLRYLCGLVRDPGHVTVIGGGLGTSVVPLRLGAPSDVWILTLGPTTAAAHRGR